ncbi:NAD(P)/FAD-dependent oxidoreductase [Deinococcus peraridilitoris]|uniref:NAD(P)/FAD-dependent oxidoreductase n=1 Tax=Deinococcus peraridilitoris TaxID=432329 RepID=UPI000301FDF5|nr:NAD(P)/FAD-dependent oxidoreductase [Deinococcus peraridilitoris]
MIVGAGPAGLSAAVYMGRFRRKTLVIDSGEGRWSYGQWNENYLGFPEGVGAQELHDLGHRQAERFGVEFQTGSVTRVYREGDEYVLTQNPGELRARSVIWAAGVRDKWPTFVGVRSLVGRQLFWCIVCDGWRTLDKRLLLLGDDDKAASTVLQFLTYSRDLTVLVDPEQDRLSSRVRKRLRDDGVKLVHGKIDHVTLQGETVEGVQLRDGSLLETDLLFSLYGSSPNTEALGDLDLELARNGHIRINAKNQTNLPGFFAAGDVTNRHAHQVISAAHEGAQAAQAANHILYPEVQRLPKLPRDG